MSTITITSKKRLVVMEESEYRRLVERLEDFEDLFDHEEAMKEYRETGGTDFREFYNSLKAKR